LRTIVVLVVLAILAGATWLATWSSRQPTPPATTDAAEHPLGYYLHGARILGTDELGRVTYRILADRLDELPDEERLRLERVSVEYRPVDATSWDISAASGSAPKDGSELALEGQVELRSARTDDTEPVVIATERLRFSPDTSSVESDEPVEIRVGDWRLNARGLRTHLKDDTLKLESEVHGTFAPQ
jgi:LPS export ABC transporter protein LptC